MVKRPGPDEAGAVTTADAYEAEQLREWTTYRARVPIDYYGVRAYNGGDPVPVSAVEGDTAWVYDDLVERVDGAQTFEGSGTVVPPEPPPIDPTAAAGPPIGVDVPPPPADAAGAAGPTTQEA